MEFDVDVNEYVNYFSKEKELDIAEEFEFIPVPPVKVASVKGEMVDDFNVELEITFTNGNTISYRMWETRRPTNKEQVAPPYYDESVILNGQKIMEHNIMEYIENYGSITRALLELYTEVKK